LLKGVFRERGRKTIIRTLVSKGREEEDYKVRKPNRGDKGCN